MQTQGVREAMSKSSWSFIREVIIAYSLNLNLSNQNWNRLYLYWAQKSLECSILLILNHKSFYTCIYMRRRIEFGRRRRRALKGITLPWFWPRRAIVSAAMAPNRSGCVRDFGVHGFPHLNVLRSTYWRQACKHHISSLAKHTQARPPWGQFSRVDYSVDY